MYIVSRIVLSFAAILLLVPFLVLFGALWSGRKTAESEGNTTSHAMDRTLDSEVSNADEDQPGVVTRERHPGIWVGIWPALGRFGIFGAHYHWGVVGLVLTLAMLSITIYCIWWPKR